MRAGGGKCFATHRLSCSSEACSGFCPAVAMGINAGILDARRDTIRCCQLMDGIMATWVLCL